MDRKSITLAVLCILLALAWPVIMQKLYPPAARPAGVVAVTNQAAQTTQAPPPQLPMTAAKIEPEQGPRVERPPRSTVAEQVAVLQNDLVRLEFTSYGGGIKHAELKKYKVSGATSALVDLNQHGKVPLGLVSGIDGFDSNTVFEIKQQDQTTLTLEAENGAGLKLTKQFKLGPDYVMAGEFQIDNQGANPLHNARLQIAIGTAAAVAPQDNFEIPYVSWGNNSTVQFTDPSAFNAGWFGRTERSVIAQENVPLLWAAVDSRFFCALWMPKTNNGTMTATREIYGEPKMTFPFFWTKSRRPYDYGLVGELSSPPIQLKPGENYRYEFTLYGGPKEYHRLQALGQRQIAVMHWWSWIEWMAELLLKSMNAVYHVIPNYFWVIILITLVIKLIFWPLTAISNRNMKAMQALSPKLTALREKFKSDPQKMNAEMMRLYREHKVNPMAGCLPTAVQIPVFIGLYNMLRTSIELRGHGFLWVKDLSQPDTILQLGGFALNPLPLVMVCTTLWQMRITPTAGDPAQQKMMMLMPLMFLFLFYGTPSGLVLYWTVQNLFTIIQMKMTKHTPAAGPLPPPSSPASKRKLQPR